MVIEWCMVKSQTIVCCLEPGPLLLLCPWCFSLFCFGFIHILRIEKRIRIVNCLHMNFGFCMIFPFYDGQKQKLWRTCWCKFLFHLFYHAARWDYLVGPSLASGSFHSQMDLCTVIEGLGTQLLVMNFYFPGKRRPLLILELLKIRNKPFCKNIFLKCGH